MDNVSIFIDELDNLEYVIIDRGNGEFTSMLKATWDAQQAAMPKQEWVEPQLTKY